MLEADAVAAGHPPPRPPSHVPAHALQVEEVGDPRTQLLPGQRLPTARGLPKELLQIRESAVTSVGRGVLTQHLSWDGPRHRRYNLAMLATLQHVCAAQHTQAGGGL